jgi:cytohesin
VDSRDGKGCTALHEAVHACAVDCVKLLLARGADTNATNDDQQTPLHYAAEAERYSAGMSRLLVGSSANVNARDSDQNTPLHLALGESNVESAQFLVQSGADLGARNGDGQTPMDMDVNANGEWEGWVRSLARQGHSVLATSM